jgi:hypothetical protein
MQSEDFYQFAASQAKSMGLFSNCLVTISHNIEEFVWHLLEPELKVSGFPMVTYTKQDYFPLEKKIDLLVGSIINYRDHNYQLMSPKIKPDLFGLLHALRKRRNISVHEAGFFYEKLMDLDNLVAPLGNLLLTLRIDNPELVIDLPQKMVCEVLVNPDNVQRTIRLAAMPPEPMYTLLECEQHEANVILTFWKREYYSYNNTPVEGEAYLIELQLGTSSLVYNLPKSQMTKLKKKMPKLQYNYGRYTLYYKFQTAFLFTEIAKFSHPRIKP